MNLYSRSIQISRSWVFVNKPLLLEIDTWIGFAPLLFILVSKFEFLLNILCIELHRLYVGQCFLKKTGLQLFVYLVLHWMTNGRCRNSCQSFLIVTASTPFVLPEPKIPNKPQIPPALSHTVRQIQFKYKLKQNITYYKHTLYHKHMYST